MTSEIVDRDLVDRVRRRLIADAAEPTAEHVAAALRVECGLVDGTLVLDVIDQLRSDSRGFGPLDPVMALPGVTDVLANGAGSVYLDRGSGLEPADVQLPDVAAVRRLAQRLAAQGGRRLDHSKPSI